MIKDDEGHHNSSIHIYSQFSLHLLRFILHGALVLYPRHWRAIVSCTLLYDNAQWEPNPLVEATAPLWN